MAKRRPSGDGMVRKREDGRWEGRIVIGHKADGTPIFHYVSAKTQKDLLKKLHQNIERNLKPYLGDKPVGKITREDVQKLYRELQRNGRQEYHPEYGHKLFGSSIRLILATQRPDANILPGQIKNNLDFRVCGRADNVLSQIILDNTSAADQIPKDAKGRFITGDGTVFQAYLLDEKQL